MTRDKLIELAQVGMGIHSPNQPEYIVCEALIKALEELKQKPISNNCWPSAAIGKETLQDALKRENGPPPQQEQEPVAHFGSAYVNENGVHITTVLGPVAIPQDAKLYITPPQRKPLTDEEIDKAWRSCDYTVPWEQHRIDIARAIEAAHGIKGEA